MTRWKEVETSERAIVFALLWDCGIVVGCWCGGSFVWVVASGVIWDWWCEVYSWAAIGWAVIICRRWLSGIGIDDRGVGLMS
jgi:hypothetical protein